MRGTFLQLALNTSYDDKSVDMITGLRAQTKPGEKFTDSTYYIESLMSFE